MHINFSIHSSFDSHLGCPLLPVMKNIAMNIQTNITFPYNCSLVLNFETEKYDFSNFAAFKDYFGYVGPLAFLCKPYHQLIIFNR